jgi:hypothetical protein
LAVKAKPVAGHASTAGFDARTRKVTQVPMN